MNIEKYWKVRWEKALYGGQYSEKEIATFVSQTLHLSGETTLLDVGCGGGLLLKNLPSKKKTGLDYSAGRIEKAKQNVPEAEFIVGNADQLPFQDASFDRVLSHSTFMYYDMKYAEKALSEMERVCKRNGIIMVGDVEDIAQYHYGPWAYWIRTRVLDALNIGHYTSLDKSFFTEKGFTVIPSPFNKRFYTIKTKK